MFRWLTLFILQIISTQIIAQPADLIAFEKDLQSWFARNPGGKSSVLKSIAANDDTPIDKIFERLQALEVLVIRRKALVDLDILQYTPQLTHLSAIGHQIKDLSTVGSLTRLRSLHLGSLFQGNCVEDISALRHLHHLEDLNLNHNRIKDLSPLQGLPIRKLAIRGNAVEDYTPLLSCKNLEELYAQRNPAQNWPVGTFESLQILELNHNLISKFSAQNRLPKLQTLSIRSNKISNLESLPHAPNLVYVSIRNNPLHDSSRAILNKEQLNWSHDWLDGRHAPATKQPQSPQQSHPKSAA